MGTQAQGEVQGRFGGGGYVEIEQIAAARTTELPVRPAVEVKKKPVRRDDHDRSQVMRRGFQAAFLLLNLYLGVIFYLWVRQFEPGGAAPSLQRPAGVEGWLPIAGLMNLRYFALTHHVPTLHPAAMFLLIAFLAM